MGSDDVELLVGTNVYVDVGDENGSTPMNITVIVPFGRDENVIFATPLVLLEWYNKLLIKKLKGFGRCR